MNTRGLVRVTVNHMKGEDALRNDTRRRGMLAGAIAGLALVALGAFLVYLGATWVEPAERVSTRSVPKVATIGLCVAGVLVGLSGIWIAIRSRK